VTCSTQFVSKPRTREIIRPEPRRFLAISPVKLDLLRVACDKCGRDGRYQVQRLINDRGRDGKIVDFLGQIRGDCPKKSARNNNDQCGAVPGFGRECMSALGQKQTSS